MDWTGACRLHLCRHRIRLLESHQRSGSARRVFWVNKIRLLLIGVQHGLDEDQTTHSSHHLYLSSVTTRTSNITHSVSDQGYTQSLKRAFGSHTTAECSDDKREKAGGYTMDDYHWTKLDADTYISGCANSSHGSPQSAVRASRLHPLLLFSLESPPTCCNTSR
jgi:hypothetical protein